MNLLYILYIPFAAAVWRLRGGAWATLLNLNIGTTITRLLTGVLLALPLIGLTNNYLFLALLALFIFVGLVVVGWAPFMDMGKETTPYSPTWLDVFPKLFNLTPNTLPWDYIGMSVCGIILFALDTLTFGLLGWSLFMLPIVFVSGLLFSTIYYLFSLVPTTTLPKLNKFAEVNTEWSEVLVGAEIAIVFLLLMFIV